MGWMLDVCLVGWFVPCRSSRALMMMRARTPKFFESFFLLIRTPLYFRKFLESTGIQYSPAATCTPTLETFGLNFGTNLPVVFGDQISLDTFFELFPASRALLIIIG
jgi:hypothetical protein